MKQILKKPFGLVLLAAAIVISKYLPESSPANFLAGLFTGLSLVLNLSFIYQMSRQKLKA